MIQPPSDVTPARLFLTLSEWRPRAPLAVRLQAAPDVSLWAQAAPSAALARAGDARAMASLCVVSEAGEPVLTPGDIGELLAPEWKAIQSELWPALLRIAPTYGGHDSRAWIETLKVGARFNGTTVRQIETCFDLVSGRKLVVHPRPDRFFGKPASELLDGHLMLFQAVKELLQPK